jgi:hypothetical protein
VKKSAWHKAAFVAEGVIDDEGDEAERDQMSEDQQAKESADLVGIPLGAGEEGVDGIEVHLGAEAGQLPDLGERAATRQRIQATTVC